MSVFLVVMTAIHRVVASLAQSLSLFSIGLALLIFFGFRKPDIQQLLSLKSKTYKISKVLNPVEPQKP